MSILRNSGLATDQAEIEYPESDGQPMAETDLHWLETVELTWMLKARYHDAPDVYVASDLLIYYEQGNPRAAVAPDVFVVFGVIKGLRRVYKLWVEGPAPAVAIEVTSRKTRDEDLRTKMRVYAELGIPEYFLYDPEGEYLRPALRGYRLAGTGYAAMSPDATGALSSEQLGLRLRLESGRVQLYDAATGERLPRATEREAVLARAEHRAQLAEAELARLRAELGLLRRDG